MNTPTIDQKPMKLHLIRHGDTQGTEQRLYYGTTDLPLSDNGISILQAQAKQGGYPPLKDTTLYSTGMKRTEETLQLIYGDVPHQALPQLCEIDFGIFEMESHETLQSREDYQQWISGDFLNNTPPQGESYMEFAHRIVGGIKPLIEQGEDVILVCHGGTIAVTMAYLFPQEEKTTYDWISKPGQGYSITLDKTPSYEIIPTLS